MSINERYVVSVDPGKATGLALLYLGSSLDSVPELLDSAEVESDKFAEKFLEFSREAGWTDGLSVVCERFTITTQTGKNSQAPFSLENIGVLKHLCRENGYPVEKIHFQSPADAKSMFPNEILKKAGTWHRGGEGHALDAIRHGLLYLVKSGWRPRVLLDSIPTIEEN